MEFTSLTLLLTDQCNFNCSYCYQDKGTRYLDLPAITKTIDYFYEYLIEDSFVNFSGGEPLLAFGLIEETVAYIDDKNAQNKKPVKFGLTTNGSLIDKKVLKFLELHKFDVMLSYDGLLQDASRHPGSSKQLETILPRLLSNPNIELKVNSVFTPDTCGTLSSCVTHMLEQGLEYIRLAFSSLKPWSDAQLLILKNELVSVRKELLAFYAKHRKIPVENFKQPEEGIFSCAAGSDRLTLSQDGKLWGCYLFSDYFKDKKATMGYSEYCFGDPEEFIVNSKTRYPEILSNYKRLSRMYCCTTSPWCMTCHDWFACAICPMNIAYANKHEGAVPSWLCAVKRRVAAEQKKLWQKIERLNS